MDEMRVFVSHNNADSGFATKLADSLCEAGADVWYDEHNLGLTDQITPTILQEIRRRRVFIVVVSDDSLKSKWVEKECLWYYSECENDPPRVILPILINGVDPRHLWVFLREFRRIEGLPHDEAINRAIDMLNREVDSYYPRHVIEAIRLRYEQVGGVSSNLSGPRLTSREAAKPRISPQGSRGYRRYYKGKASIYWNERGGAQPVWGAIREIYPGREGPLGFPLTEEFPAAKSPYGTHGVFQRFEGESNYPSDINHDPDIPYGATIYWSARHGAHATTGPIGECYERLSGTHGFCGFPTSSEQKAHSSPRGTTGRCQHFEGASIHWHEHGGAHPVGGAFRRVYAQLDGSGGTLGFPLTHEVTATPSPYGTEGVYQRFESTWDYPDDVVQLVQGIRCGATVYWSAKTGAHPTWAGIGTIYERLYGTGGVMGFPLSAEIPITSSVTGDTGVHQKFEGGGIYWRKQTNSVVPVVGHVYRLFEDLGGVAGTYGFPLSPEESRPAGERLQAFEGGVISVISPP